MKEIFRTVTFDPKDGGLPYRRAVLMVVFNRQGKIFIGESTKIPADGKSWQMPQGGMKEYLQDGAWLSERASQAARRELKEELGSAAQFDLIRTLPERLIYNFPDNNPKYRGQVLTPILARCASPDGNFNIGNREEGDALPAFSDWKWADVREVLRGVTAVKYQLYEQVLESAAPIIAGATMTQRQRRDAGASGMVRPVASRKLSNTAPLFY